MAVTEKSTSKRSLRPGVAAALPNTRLPDPVELAAQNVANRDYATTDAGLTAEAGGITQSFGLDDPSNPFSKAALLKQNFEQAKARAINGSGNNLYAGSLQNALNATSDNYNQGYAGLRSQQTSLLDSIVQRRASAGTARDDAIETAAGAAIGRAVSTPVDPATVPAKKKQLKPKKGV